MTAFKDHFSGHAAAYAQARPTYPAALFAWLAGQCRGHRLAWDAGCGNGQAALALVAHFAQVVATDPSAGQIAAAPPHPRIAYRVEPAEHSTLPAASVDLIVVAQALHWFDVDAHHAEVRRVAATGAVYADGCYGLSTVNEAIDVAFMHLYRDIVGPYWPPERRHIESAYAELPFPFEPMPAPGFALTLDWTLPQYLTYLRSWSASERYRHDHGADPVALVEPAMTEAWGDPTTTRTVRWPLSLRVGRV